MKGWAELKDAFWAAVDADPAEQARHVEALHAVHPELPARLEALLAADDRGATFQHLFAPEPTSTAPPARIGAYEILGVLGAGGMGEVYRARDARLQRDVAIKVLPAAVSNEPGRLARLEHEAQVLASLNHPNVAQVYGLDESGGMPAIIMELVHGPTLADLIAGYPDAPLSVPRALTIACQIADGLDAAHDKGIVHRDLKPRNVALTQDGDVKILDFGVAKTAAASAPKRAGTPGATEPGLLLGTPAYMSPEQARGSVVDRRTDIWAFGCLLYELLSGRQAFAGDTASDSLVAVLEREPDMALVPAGTPAAVRSLLRHCLEKDPKRRLRDIADARLAIDDALSPSTGEPPGHAATDVRSTRSRMAGRMAWPLAGLALAAAAWIVVSEGLPGMSSTDPGPKTVTSIVLPRGMRLGGGDLRAQSSESRFAISPDGRRLALVAADESGRSRLWLRDLGSAAFQPLPQTDAASFPFWSPDSEFIGYVTAGRLRAIRLSDSALMTVADTGFRMGAWSRDNQILFAPAPSSPLFVVPASGGVPTPVTSIESSSGEVQHGDPVFLPDGRHFLYFAIGSLTGGLLDARGTYLGSLDATEPARLLLPGATQARYASGHILFVQQGTLMAHPFDLQRRELRGAAFPLVEDVKLATAGATGPTAAFSVSDAGVLAYQAAGGTQSSPVIFDRAGTQLLALAAPADYSEVAFSPDGARVAASVLDPVRSTRDLWIYDVDGGRGQRLTFDPGDEFAPVWSPDGSRLLFSALAKGLVNLHVTDVASTSAAPPIPVDDTGLGRFAADWSREGRHILYVGGGRAIARSDLWVAPVDTPQDARALLDSSFVETHGRFAPDGRGLAYTSNETGRLEVYVDRFPERGAKRPVSMRGGHSPRWAADGTELFYVSSDSQLMAVAVTTNRDRLEIGVPRALFAIRPRPPVRLDAYPYDVSPDGQRFVVNTLMDDTTSTTITVVMNWAADRR